MDGTVDGRANNGRVVVCPHCAREVPAAMADMHASVCARRPEMVARIAAALVSDVPGVGIKVSVYARNSKTLDVPPVSTLLRNFGGTWEAVLDAFGLTPQPSKRHLERTPTQRRMTAQQREAAACADVAAMDDAVRAMLAGEYQRGLAVYAPHPAKGGGVGYYVR